MSVKKIESGLWLCDIRPNGSTGKRYRKQFETKAEALRWEAWIKTHKTIRKSWEPEKNDNRRLSELIERYYETHGISLKNGRNQKALLLNIAERMGNPLARTIKAADFAIYQQSRIAEGIKPSTTNLERRYLQAVFYELERLGDWQHGNPIKGSRKAKETEPKRMFLTLEQIDELLKALQAMKKSKAYFVARICLETGCRWNEANELELNQISEGHIRFENTKNHKSRIVPINKDLFDCIPKREGRLFVSCIQGFTETLKNLSFAIPKGKASHLLRHTFASHFVMNGGNLIALQRILGHSNLNMTMIYSHLSPDFIDTAKTLNPIAKLDEKRTTV